MRAYKEKSGCINCGSCVLACPVLAKEGVSRFSGPRNLAVQIPRFGQLEIERDDLLMCTTCWKCEEVCPADLPLPEAMLRVRRAVFSSERMLEGHRRLVENIDLHHRSVAPTVQAPPPQRREGAAIMYFPGCIAEQRITPIFSASVGALEKVGTVFDVPGGWVCCGAPLEKIGDWDRLDRLRSENLAVFEAHEDIVTSCPGCTTQLLLHYRLEPLHTIEFIYERVGVERLRLTSKGRRVRVALHHPCHLSRTLGPHVIDYAYSILECVPALELVELDEPDVCCGGGGGVVAGYPDIALDLAASKIADAKSVGADLLLAPCPFCVLNLRRVGGIEVEDFMTFINARLQPL